MWPFPPKKIVMFTNVCDFVYPPTLHWSWFIIIIGQVAAPSSPHVPPLDRSRLSDVRACRDLNNIAACHSYF